MDGGDKRYPVQASPLFVPEEGDDLPRYIKTPVNTLLVNVYRGYVHNNNGTQLAGSVQDDAA